ncbi:hypothetical protein FNH22_29350 [Fulvivirga sp. M361]|uniref:LVIVD repeat-containing protein n=1 Tax=Fulvivirga sp. M361 TaxID=2594266 RepID=UPI001179C508|nr:hypothetical protein [Fulvivirga sp. M361]TRX48282.1 hypothetical protein FNH22_29350 [Fulvivirga sp. M361]
MKALILQILIRQKEKIIWFLSIALLIIVGFFAGGCTEDCEQQTQYFYMEPVYTSLSEIRTAVNVTEPVEIKHTGKIFFKDNLLFVNEPNEGIHVIDNSDPSNPSPIAFITVPGSFDLAVKGNVLFTDSYIDLIAIDITDVRNANEIDRIENLFDGYNSYGFYADPQLGIVTDWEESGMVDVIESDCAEGIEAWGGIYYESGLAMADASGFSRQSAIAPSNPGVGGSMARFALSGDFLYAIDADKLQPVDVSLPSAMTAADETVVNWGIETIFPNNDVLFIGAQDGMYIMDISNPSAPDLISNYQHVNSCDPVIVDGDLAFVTLRSGTECQGFTNQLEVIDISDLKTPRLLHTYAMDNPHGLGKEGDALFICDGASGLKVYDASDVSVIDKNQLVHYSDIQAFDIIPFNNVAMMIGANGLYQYDYSDLNDIKLLSQIKVSNGIE